MEARQGLNYQTTFKTLLTKKKKFKFIMVGMKLFRKLKL